MLNKLDDHIKGVIFATSYSTIFGFSMFFTKGIIKDYDITTLLGWRFLFSFLAMLIAIKLKLFKVNLKNKDISRLFKLALFAPILYFSTETLGLQRLTTSESGILISIIPIVSLILSTMIIKEAPNKFQIAGVILSLVGIIVNVLSAGLKVEFNILGYIFMCIAVFSAGMQAVISRSIKNFTAIEKTFVMMGTGAFVFFPIAVINSIYKNNFSVFIQAPLIDINFIISILYLSIGSSILAFFMSHKAIEYLGANGNASFSGLSTIITIAVGVFVLKEDFSIFQVVSAILVLGGVYIANFGHKFFRKIKE